VHAIGPSHSKEESDGGHDPLGGTLLNGEQIRYPGEVSCPKLEISLLSKRS
jgi:hypothetical protein